MILTISGMLNSGKLIAAKKAILSIRASGIIIRSSKEL